MVESVGREHGIRFPMQGTIALADGATIWAFRYSTQGMSRSLFHSVDIETLRGMYPDIERLKIFGRRARVVVSEPLNDLPGAFVEVPESTVAILDESGYRHQPVLRRGGVAPSVRDTGPDVPAKSGHGRHARGCMVIGATWCPPFRAPRHPHDRGPRG